MPFDVRDFPDASAHDHAASRPGRLMVARWLFVIAGMILVMIALGGATRLTGSGLSIMEWAPLMGTLPPLSEAEWHRLFGLYQQIPQYHLVNEGFGLDGFKQIFWLEWTHRLWGRLMGLAFIGPLLWFWATGRIERRLIGPMILLFVLGGLQGAVGWFMVASGFFPDSTAVSPYRLTIHLSFALILYIALIWTGLSVIRPRGQLGPEAAGLRRLAALSITLVSLTIVAGGFVAGLHAGLDYNTFPLMDGRVIPEGYARLSPFLLNLTENVAAVQFDHRVLATLSLLAAGATAFTGLRLAGEPALRRPLMLLAGAVLAQYGLGIATLLLVVPAALAVIHQVGAVLLLTAVLVVLHASRARPAVPAGGS